MISRHPTPCKLILKRTQQWCFPGRTSSPHLFYQRNGVPPAKIKRGGTGIKYEWSSTCKVACLPNYSHSANCIIEIRKSMWFYLLFDIYHVQARCFLGTCCTKSTSKIKLYCVCTCSLWLCMRPRPIEWPRPFDFQDRPPTSKISKTSLELKWVLVTL
jgi:hypothetical protein